MVLKKETSQEPSQAKTAILLAYESKAYGRGKAACLGATKLHVGGVDFTPKQLVEGRVAGQDDGLVCSLHTPPSQPG